ncbi:MAG TPA: glycosyltransferase family 39 protein, partial [Pyrinomonadaceae bacterium]|nr:glycosyltransferase family 39 protein [Pyrinomonadaceae bacterium]
MDFSGVTALSEPGTNNATVRDRRYAVAWLIALLVALLHAFLAVTAVNTKSPTFDEPQHLAAGFSYWKTDDFRLDPENGMLSGRWAALPLLFEGAHFVPLEDNAWRHADDAGVAHEVLYQAGNNPDRMMAQARLMMSLFGAALCLLVYRIGCEFFGLIGGLVAEVFLAFDPNFLAHGALVTSDVAATFFFTAIVWTCWRLFQKISLIRLSLAGLSLSGLFLTKFSAPIVLPVLAVISILQISSKNKIAVCFGRFGTVLATTWKKLAAVSAAWICLGLVVVTAIWSSFSFRYSALTDNGPARKVWDNCWTAILSDHTAAHQTIEFARVHHLLPEAYLCGLAYTQKSAEIRPAFLNNHWSLIGFSSFFPLAFLYKTPLPFLCLIALAAVIAISRRKDWHSSNFLNPFFLFAVI